MKHFVHLIRVLGGGGGGICHAYVDSSDIKVSAKEDLIRVNQSGDICTRRGTINNPIWATM